MDETITGLGGYSQNPLTLFHLEQLCYSNLMLAKVEGR